MRARTDAEVEAAAREVLDLERWPETVEPQDYHREHARTILAAADAARPAAPDPLAALLDGWDARSEHWHNPGIRSAEFLAGYDLAMRDVRRTVGAAAAAPATTHDAQVERAAVALWEDWATGLDWDRADEHMRENTREQVRLTLRAAGFM